MQVGMKLGMYMLWTRTSTLQLARIHGG